MTALPPYPVGWGWIPPADFVGDVEPVGLDEVEPNCVPRGDVELAPVPVVLVLTDSEPNCERKSEVEEGLDSTAKLEAISDMPVGPSPGDDGLPFKLAHGDAPVG